LAATRSQITRRDDDRELQTEQTIVSLPARKLQPDRTDARSWYACVTELDPVDYRLGQIFSSGIGQQALPQALCFSQ
jgi:hypothetical protein